jgi:hypothetical protein
VWLILCTADDTSALWAANRLRARGLAPLVVLTPELLHYSFRWRHRIGNDAPPSVEFTLADGRTIRSPDIRGVLNRIPFLPPTLVTRLAPGDRSYALQEWTALHISWLTALGVPVLNRPVLQGLCGAFRHMSEWTWLASRAGLPTQPFHQSGSRPVRPRVAVPVGSVLVVDRQVIGRVDHRTADACRRLAETAGTRMLGVELDRMTGNFVDASPRPFLQSGGEPLIDALCAALTSADPV